MDAGAQVGRGGGQHAEQRDADGDADLLGGGDQAGRQALFLVGDAGGDGQAVGDDRAQVAHAGQGDRGRDEHHRPAALPDRQQGQPQQSLPGERADQGAAGAEAADDAGCAGAGHHRQHTLHAEDETGLEGAQAQDLLEVQGEDEDHRRHHGEGDQAAQVAPGHRAAAQHRQGDQGRRAAGLDGDKGGQEQHARGEGDEDVGAAEAVLGGRGQGVDEGEQAAGDGDRAGDVEAGPLGSPGLGQQTGREGQHEQGEQGEQAHRGAPAQQVGQDAAGHHADGEAQREQGAGDAEGAVAGGALREGRREQGHAGRDDGRRAEPLEGAPGEEGGRVPGEGGQEGGGTEEREAGEESRRRP